MLTYISISRCRNVRKGWFYHTWLSLFARGLFSNMFLLELPLTLFLPCPARSFLASQGGKRRNCNVFHVGFLCLVGGWLFARASQWHGEGGACLVPFLILPDSRMALPDLCLIFFATRVVLLLDALSHPLPFLHPSCASRVNAKARLEDKSGDVNGRSSSVILGQLQCILAKECLIETCRRRSAG